MKVALEIHYRAGGRKARFSLHLILSEISSSKSSDEEEIERMGIVWTF
jgi:hypothetical protein